MSFTSYFQFLSNVISCVTNVFLVVPSCTFTIGLIVLLVWFYLSGVVLGSFFSLEALFFDLPALALTGFLEGFFYTLFSSLEALLSLNSVCLSSDCIALNISIPSKSNKAVIIFEVISW